MLCGYPLTLANKAKVPCGQCMNCRINRKRSWIGRLFLEMKYASAESSFVTLTYDEQSVPSRGDQKILVPGDLQGAINRIRARSGVGKVRYFGVGEYGDDFLRPHFHIMLFGVPAETWQKRLHTTWREGISHVYPADTGNVHYICGYTTKKMTSEKDDRLEGRPPEFSRMSKNPPLAAAGMRDIRDRMMSRQGSAAIAVNKDVPGCYRVRGRVYPITPYWRDWLRKELGVTEPSEKDWEVDLDEKAQKQKRATFVAQKRFDQKNSYARRKGLRKLKKEAPGAPPGSGYHKAPRFYPASKEAKRSEKEKR